MNLQVVVDVCHVGPELEGLPEEPLSLSVAALLGHHIAQISKS
jgi:hypothetical protein